MMTNLKQRIAVDRDTHDNWSLIAKIWKMKLSEALDYHAKQLLEMYIIQGIDETKPEEKKDENQEN